MAQHRRQRSFQSFSRTCLSLAVMTLMCAAVSMTAQQQPPPLPLPLPQPQPTTTATGTVQLPSVPACLPAQATLSPCVSYLIGNSSSPPTECCAQIRAMFQSQAPCLCAALAASGPAQQLGSALGQLLPTSCDLPADACSGTSAAPAGPASGTASAAAPPAAATEPNAVNDDPTAQPGGAGIKSVPGLLASAAAAGSSGIPAAALSVSLLVVYLLSTLI